MLFRELLELPVGYQVLEELKITKTVPGVVESLKHGPHFIRWADGFVTFPFGWIQDCDEYIATRTEAQPSRCTRIHLGFDCEKERDESTVSRDRVEAESE
jgi:hypothetical protein